MKIIREYKMAKKKEEMDIENIPKKEIKKIEVISMRKFVEADAKLSNPSNPYSLAFKVYAEKNKIKRRSLEEWKEIFQNFLKEKH